MNTIKTYELGSEEYNTLSATAKTIQAFTGCPTYVKDTWYDAGAKLDWTTIVTCRPGKPSDSYQMLYPAQHEKILYGSVGERMSIIAELIDKHLYKKSVDRE